LILEGFKETKILQARVVAETRAVMAAGWDEAALFETVLVVSLMNFANRFAMVADWQRTSE